MNKFPWIRDKVDSLRACWWRFTERRKISRHLATLEDCLREYPDSPVIAFPPGLGWQTQLFQRPQQLALSLARRGALVFYLEPEHTSFPSGFHQEQQRLYRCHIPIRTFYGLDHIWVYALTWNWKFVERFGAKRVIYDVVDHLTAFKGNPQTLRLAHERLARTATLVLATSGELHRQVSLLRPDVQLCPNGVDYDHFIQARELPDSPPPDLIPILAARKPIIGYSGALAAWMDYSLVAHVASRCLDLSFLLIGPNYDRSLPASLVSMQNVYWLGMKSYVELPNYLHYFDVAIIPFRLDDVTHATSPIKLFEYMAAGKPIVTTAMLECRNYPEVLIARDESEFVSKLKEALELRNDPAYLQALDRRAQQNSWDIRADVIFRALGTFSR